MSGCRCMSCDDCKEETRNSENYLAEIESIERSDALTKARDAVIEAARRMRENDTSANAQAVFDAVNALEKLEQPPDPLEPVREFVRLSGKALSSGAEYIQINESFINRLKAAAKALGMEDK